jgi:hypothetical protein
LAVAPHRGPQEKRARNILSRWKKMAAASSHAAAAVAAAKIGESEAAKAIPSQTGSRGIGEGTIGQSGAARCQVFESPM